MEINSIYGSAISVWFQYVWIILICLTKQSQGSTEFQAQCSNLGSYLNTPSLDDKCASIVNPEHQLVDEEMCANLGDGMTFDPANVSFINRPADTRVNGSERVVFTCKTDPEALLIFWSFEGNYVLPDSISLEGPEIRPEKLIVKETGPNLYGKYKCEVITAKGFVKASASLTKDCRYLGFGVEPENVAVQVDDDRELFCSGAEEHIQVEWYKKRSKHARTRHKTPHIRLRHNDHNYRIKINNGYLKINNAKISDDGEYICKIKDNKTGCEKTASAKVTVYTEINEICGETPLHAPYSLNIFNAGNHDRINNGKSVPVGSAPWQVSLQQVAERVLDKHKCGGIILNKNWVITAAHCALKTVKSVVAGIRNLLHEERHKQTVLIGTFIKHSRYNNITKEYDIALVKLNSPGLKFNDYVRPVCLPSDNDIIKITHRTQIRNNTVITGWGGTSGTRRNNRLLQEAVVAVKTCRSNDEKEAMFCAGGGHFNSTDSCEGDSGGPLTVPINTNDTDVTLTKQNVRWYLAGVISNGPYCQSHAGRPSHGKYINVTNTRVLEFIRR